MNNLNIVTFNCNGALKNKDYQQTLISFFQLNRINIALLQETHIDNLSWKKEIDNIFNCNSLWSFGSNSSRGVAILLFKNFYFNVNKFVKDMDGRIISANITSDFGETKLMSIYCPNEPPDRKRFLKTLDFYVSGPDPILMGGDWNCVENTVLDKEGGNPNKGTEGAEIIKEMKNTYEVMDPFREIHPKLKIFTWVNETTGVKTRIDRFYINKFMKTNIVKVNKVTSIVSDHAGFMISLQGNLARQFSVGKGIWKLNTEILKNENFVLEIEDIWHE